MNALPFREHVHEASHPRWRIRDEMSFDRELQDVRVALARAQLFGMSDQAAHFRTREQWVLDQMENHADR